jgi:BirA family biotin operon repressor/biotin-[acetyl-CoA-carboxylase] ligase
VRIGQAAAAAGYGLRSYETVGSTNDEARDAAMRGEAGPLWFVAGEQTSGRGRHGRVWVSPPGNLHATLLLVDPAPAAEASRIGFVAGLALYDAVAELTGLRPPRLALKWPNDLLVDGAKVAGILLEGLSLPGGGLAVLVGMGVNVVAAPTDTPYPARALHAVSPDLDREILFVALANAFAARFEDWQAARAAIDGFEATRRAWTARAMGVGERVTVRLPGGPRSGQYAGIDVSGRLELLTESGVERFDAGDLFFGEVSAPAGPGRGV